MFGFLGEIRQLRGMAGGNADHGGMQRLELVDSLREQVSLDVAARGVCGREEVDHHRPFLQCIGQIECERLAGEIGRRGEFRCLGAFLQCSKRRRREDGGADEAEGGEFQQ